MTLDDVSTNKNPAVFYSISTSSIELILQSRCSRAKAIARGWVGLLLFNIFGLAFSSVLSILAAVVCSVLLGPILPKPTMTVLFGVILAGGYGMLIALNGYVVWTTGFTTFVFDRIQKKLVVNTINPLGRKYLRTIP